MDGILTGVYGLYMIAQFLLVRKLYRTLKTNMGPVATQTNCHIFLMKLIIFLHLSLRIIMNSLSDSGAKVQGNITQQVSWVYILLGDAITEMLSASGMILLMTCTFRFEALAKTYLLQFRKNILY